jgi:UDP-GlcNAc:undecaprenyl-phosphate GlcNAc-1-phosphate transferase
LSGPPPFLVAAPLAFGAALLFTPIMRRIARASGYLDHPDPRKPHPEPTALLGGVAIALSLVAGPALARLLFSEPVPVPPAGVIAGALLSLALGLQDDRRPMGAAGKLVGQIAAAAFLVYGGPEIPALRDHPLAQTAALFGVVALFNAVNFLDAMDGIVAAVIPITAAGFVAIGLLDGAPVDLSLAWALIGACAGFLVYNAPPARIFMGDAGSHLLGFALGALALQALAATPVTIPHLAAILILVGYPLFDVLFVTWVRLAQGRPIHVGGVDHTTHRLGRRFGPWGALGVASGAVALNACVAACVWRVGNPQIAMAAVLVSGLGYAIFGVWLGRNSPTP